MLARTPTSRAELLAKQNKAIAKIKVPPKKISHAEWIAYQIDQYISTRKGQIATLSLLGGLLIIIGAIFLKVVQVSKAFAETVWEAWTYLADPGSHTGLTIDSVRVIGVLVTLVGILYFSVIMGFVVDGIRDKMDMLKKGKSNVAEEKHTSRELDIMHSDSHSLASLLLIRDLQARSLKETHGHLPDAVPDYCKCISEILDPRTQRTISTSATILKLSEFIQSNELVSCILAMISESRDVRVILDELLGPQGAYFEVRGEESTTLNPEGKDQPRIWSNVDMVVIRNPKTTFASRKSSLSVVNAEDFERTTKSRQVKDQISRQRLLSAIIQDADHGGNNSGSDDERTAIVRALSAFAEDEEEETGTGGFAVHPASFTFGQRRQTSVRGLIAAARMLADALEHAENSRSMGSETCDDVEEAVSAFINSDNTYL
ncbi:Ion channel [Phytophthora cinnamomi]|uniref:Ion channel n=1 Tax=Phytophthora cinnamomi TaxID=4785 RepID=UPI00355A6FAB|nr:Ion channel [Phytophthora cinnamomi]